MTIVVAGVVFADGANIAASIVVDLVAVVVLVWLLLHLKYLLKLLNQTGQQCYLLKLFFAYVFEAVVVSLLSLLLFLLM